MLQDSAFSLDTERVREGLDAAKKTKAWVLHNRKEGQFFEQQLTKFLKKCFSSGVSTNAAQEMVWGHYHKLRSSPAFRSLWKTLLTLVGCSTTDDPIFMQYITHHIFKQLLKEEFPLQPAATHDSAVPALSDEENNVVRYVAGYICNKLYKRLMKSKTDHDLTYGIVDMVDEDKCGDASATWTKLVDRGGLFYVTDEVYGLFISIEIVARRQLQVGKVMEFEAGVKEKIIKDVMKSDSVMMQWELVGVELERERGEILLKLIVNEWITLRGFSFATGLVELYKQANRQSLQKSKGLRSKLSTKKDKVEETST